MIGFYENFKHAFWIKNITTNIRAFGLKLKEIQTHFYIKADTWVESLSVDFSFFYEIPSAFINIQMWIQSIFHRLVEIWTINNYFSKWIKSKFSGFEVLAF